MSYKPERALTRICGVQSIRIFYVEMSYKPERALTHVSVDTLQIGDLFRRNEL